MPKPPPKGFRQYKKNGRYYLRCTNTIQTPHGLVQCSYVVRKDTKKREHKCRFSSLDNYALFHAHKDSSIITEIASIPLIDYIVKFISETNISFRGVCSESMLNLLRAAFEEGKNAGAKSVEDIIPPMKRKSLTQYFIKKADAKRSASLNTLMGCYVAITMDASTDIAQSCLDICVSHPYLHPKPILVDSISNFGGTTEDYRAVFANIACLLREQGLAIGGATTDNCIAQVQAISQRSETSFQYCSENPEDKTIIWVSCICHILALGVKSFFDDDAIDPDIRDFQALVVALRRKPIRKFLNATCVAPSNTRWNVTYLQMQWMIEHFEELLGLFNCHDASLNKYIDPIRAIIPKVMTETIPSIIPSLQIVSAALNEAQGDSFPAALTFSLVDSLENKLKAISHILQERYSTDPTYTQIIQQNAENSHKLASSISLKFSKHAPCTLLELMYILTPEGRADFRRGYPAVVISPDPSYAYVGRTDFDVRLDEQNKIIRYMDKLAAIRRSFTPLNQGQSNDSDVSETEETPQESSASSSDESSEEESTEDESEITTENIELNDSGVIKQGDPTSIFTSALEEQLILTHTREEVNNAIGCFLKWVMDSTDNLCITPLILENPVKIWTFLKTKEEWRVLADFSLRCFSLVASEAGVERMFSKHKLVVTHLRRRTSKELRIARLEMKE